MRLFRLRKAKAAPAPQPKPPEQVHAERLLARVQALFDDTERVLDDAKKLCTAIAGGKS